METSIYQLLYPQDKEETASNDILIETSHLCDSTLVLMLASVAWKAALSAGEETPKAFWNCIKSPWSWQGTWNKMDISFARRPRLTNVSSLTGPFSCVCVCLWSNPHFLKRPTSRSSKDVRVVQDSSRYSALQSVVNSYRAGGYWNMQPDSVSESMYKHIV